ncbi:TetR/AcrR family transcriptional regulator [Variovorax sp. J31P179]|uniref:TetR/AcrR family transcriptional regulator n=1 Tax=Variovorax sp. J31P179 TaxID=3053508 RepID=UPI002578587D|nr:TetR/AcrR family transcriptional regulator [Variovorax sp. J31P179]MDM0084831.1 TetR/AcrR family transcriptional regulator [Variovorax sp. J31P179]
MTSKASQIPTRSASQPAARKLRALPPQLREPTYERGGLRNALVEEGRRMFEENGASELSLRALARRLGVSEAAPSRHFKGKEELLAAIAISGFKELAEQRMEISARHLPALPKAREMMLSYVRFAQMHAGLFDLMTGPRLLQEFVRGDVEATSNISYSYFSDSVFELALESGWDSEQLHYLSHAAWSTEHGVAALLLGGRIPRTDSDLDPQRMIEFSIDLFLAAVVSGPEKFEQTRMQPPSPRRS